MKFLNILQTKSMIFKQNFANTQYLKLKFRNEDEIIPH